ncbi:MAG: response regulator transcription factor, partial [Candidatus Dormibacteria bacterium]
LTPAESRVAIALFEGLTKAQIARKLDLSFFTVRGHLARVFDKTRVHRQAELVALISRLGTPLLQP